VTNSSSQPIPAAQSGTWSVEVSGTPTVNAQQAGAPWSVDIGSPTVTSAQGGAWNVGLVGTPTVNVSNPAGGSLGVTVGNTVQASILGTANVAVAATQSASPTSTFGGTAKDAIVTVNAYEGRQPFFLSVSAFKNAQNAATTSLILNTSGKRLVIEYLSGVFAVDTGQTFSPLRMFIEDQQINTKATIYFAPVLTNSFSGRDTYVINQSVKMYVDDGDILGLQAIVNAPVSYIAGNVYLHGYLIDH
jgi:hypothetical protein